MKTITLVLGATLLTALLTVYVRARGPASEESGRREASPAAPTPAPGGVHGLVYARRFALAEPYAHDWRAEPVDVQAGWLLVLEVDRALATPRNEAEPVLYGGAETLERVSSGQGSGRLVAILPGDADLASTPFWFGAPELPERVTGAMLASARAEAEAAGVRPFGAEAVAAALAAGGETLVLPGRGELRRAAAELVLAHSPDEVDLAQGILAPLAR
jgi:hypothetical protein